jgi:hypothetical protein
MRWFGFAIALLWFAGVAQAEQIANWKVNPEKPAIELRGTSKGILRIACDTPDRSIYVTVSSGAPLRKGDEPIRAAFLRFDKDDIINWVWSYEGRKATLSNASAVNALIARMQSARIATVSVKPSAEDYVNFRFRLLGADRAIERLRSLCMTQ